MIKLKISALTEKGIVNIGEYNHKIKPQDRFLMKRMGTTVEVSEDHKELTINLNQIELRALAHIKSNPALRKQYEEDIAKKSIEDLEKELTKLEIVKDTDYTLEVL